MPAWKTTSEKTGRRGSVQEAQHSSRVRVPRVASKRGPSCTTRCTKDADERGADIPVCRSLAQAQIHGNSCIRGADLCREKGRQECLPHVP